MSGSGSVPFPVTNRPFGELQPPELPALQTAAIPPPRFQTQQKNSSSPSCHLGSPCLTSARGLRSLMTWRLLRQAHSVLLKPVGAAPAHEQKISTQAPYAEVRFTLANTFNQFHPTTFLLLGVWLLLCHLLDANCWFAQRAGAPTRPVSCSH